jgi:hypothetical protein
MCWEEGLDMPVHDWTRVNAGTYHDFHSAWITHLKEALNAGILPEDCYAMAEQVAGQLGPDVLTLQTNGDPGAETSVRPPAAAGTGGWRVVIHHASDDRILAIIEIISPGNKNSADGIRAFRDKVLAALSAGIHLLIVDLFPPGRRHPQGINGVLWQAIDQTQPYAQPFGKPLTLVGYRSGTAITPYLHAVAVGDVMSDVPLFLHPVAYIDVPLEQTYQRAYQGLPRRSRQVLEAAV